MAAATVVQAAQGWDGGDAGGQGRCWSGEVLVRVAVTEGGGGIVGGGGAG